jgi:hypothetical protein
VIYTLTRQQAIAAATLQTDFKKIDDLMMIAWDALGIAQHHDSIPGTMSAQGSYVHWHTDSPGPSCNDTSCMVETYSSKFYNFFLVQIDFPGAGRLRSHDE